MGDLFEDFMMGKAIQRRVISGGSTNGRIATEYERPNYKEDIVPERTNKYAERFTRKIRDEIWKVSLAQLDWPSNTKILSLFRDLSKEVGKGINQNQVTFTTSTTFRYDIEHNDCRSKIIVNGSWTRFVKTQ